MREPELGKITVAFGYPSAGWVLMAILATHHNQHLVIHCSDVFDPFIDLVEWLHKVANGNLPAEFEIDEEGRLKRFIVEQSKTDKKEVEFRIEDPWVKSEEKVEKSTVFIRCLLNRKQMLKEFAERLHQWLENDYDPLKFGYHNAGDIEEGYGFDLRKSIDINRLHAKVNAL